MFKQFLFCFFLILISNVYASNKDKIIEKINMYFGYKAINTLKIKQNFITNKIANKNKEKIEKKIINEAEIKKETNKIKNKNLENSVVKLGISITNEENK